MQIYRKRNTKLNYLVKKIIEIFGIDFSHWNDIKFLTDWKTIYQIKERNK